MYSVNSDTADMQDAVLSQMHREYTSFGVGLVTVLLLKLMNKGNGQCGSSGFYDHKLMIINITFSQDNHDYTNFGSFTTMGGNT